ncbi:hypothetical protein [Streptomyces sp. NPDC051219]|uniref:hypothetical protein n=1 Tax=Streptomyces sp. NPDC051219 TaxID=3155283 RepID=UPI003417E128
MPVRDSRSHLAGMYGVAVSPDVIGKVTDAVTAELAAGRTGRWRRSGQPDS